MTELHQRNATNTHDPLYNSDVLATDAEQELERIVGDFEDQWAAGGEPRIEDQLARATIVDRDELLLELIHVDIERRAMAGIAAQLDDYLRRFPSLADQADSLADLKAKLAGRSTAETRGSAEETNRIGEKHSADSLDVGLPELPGFEVLRELGRGGMGTVYEAWQPSLQRHVAIKMVESDRRYVAELAARLKNEARSVAALQHPHIVAVYDVREHRGQPFLVMEHLSGGNLQDRIAQAPLESRAAAELVLKLASAMERAHAARLVHRDLKPGNILFAADGTPKISDFGLARNLADDVGLTRSGDILGTPCYMAPEQARGDAHVGPAADVYALGGVLYSALTGERPFQGVSVHEVLGQVENDPPIAPRKLKPSIPRDLETICLKCLEKEPTRRYSSMEMLAADLQRLLTGQTVLARRAGPLLRMSRWARRNRAVAALLLIVLLGAATMLAGSIAYSVQLSEALDVAEQRRHDAEQSQLAALQARDDERLAREQAVEASHRAQQAEAQARAEAQRAQSEANAADRTADFLVSLFRSGDTSGINPLGMLSSADAVTSTIDVADLLARGHERISTELADYPRARAKLLVTLGSVAVSRADVAGAEGLLLEAIELIETKLPDDSELLAAALHEQGTLYLQLWEFKRAIESFQRATTLREQLLPENSLQLLETRFRLGLSKALYTRGTGDGLDILMSIVQMRDRVPSSPEADRFFEQVRMLALLGELTKPGEGSDQLKRLQSVSRLLDRQEANGLARVLMKVLRAQGDLEKFRFQKAIEAYDEIVVDVDRIFGDTNSVVVHLAKLGHASLHVWLGDYLKMRPAFEEILAWAEQLMPLHEQVITSRLELLPLLAMEGDLAACEHHARQLQQAYVALGSRPAVDGPSSEPNFAWASGDQDAQLTIAHQNFKSYTNELVKRPHRDWFWHSSFAARQLISLLLDRNELAAAAEVAQRLDDTQMSVSSQIADTSDFPNALAILRCPITREHGDREQIAALVAQCSDLIPGYLKTYLTDLRGRRITHLAATVDTRFGAWPYRLFREYMSHTALDMGVALPVLEQMDGYLEFENDDTVYAPHPTFGRIHAIRAKALAALDRQSEAEESWQLGLENLHRNFGPDHMTVCVYDSDYAVWLAGQDRLSEADDVSRDAVERALHKAPQGHPWSEIVLGNRARVLRQQQRHAEALPMHEQRGEFIARFAGPHSRAQAVAIVERARCLEALGQIDGASALLRQHRDELASLLPSGNWRIAMLSYEIARLGLSLDADNGEELRRDMAEGLAIVHAAWGENHTVSKMLAER